uniref:Uncharacterized protein n=1 Tax=Romanomermis culicivorax TaxID=13658 RepID=A0A915K4R5_ROMCU
MVASEQARFSEIDVPPPTKKARISASTFNREEENKLRLDLINKKMQHTEEEHKVRMKVTSLEKEAAIAKNEYYRKKTKLMDGSLKRHSPLNK